MKRLVSVVIVVVAIGLGACGDDQGGGDSAPRRSEGAGSAPEYCDLIEELNKRSESLDNLPENPTPEQAQDVFADFVEDNAELLDDLVDAAPEEIGPDVEAFIAAFRTAATEGDFTAIEAADNTRIDEYESKNC